MPWFRKKVVTLAEAQRKLADIALGYAGDDDRLCRDFADLVPERRRLISELLALRLFAILVASKETKQRSWSRRGRELFDAAHDHALPSLLNVRREAEPLVRDWLAERLRYYSMSSEGVHSIEALGAEVGESFRTLLSDAQSSSLTRLGQGVFFRSFDQTLALHNDGDLEASS